MMTGIRPYTTVNLEDAPMVQQMNQRVVEDYPEDSD